VVQYNLTLVEGWTFRQVRAAVAKHEKIKHTLDGLSDAEVMDKLGHTGVFPEGRFFPDTYRFVRGMTDVELLQQAYMRLDEVLAKEWAERAPDCRIATLPGADHGLAGGKGNRRPQERGQIAGVFVRRMRLGMMLQTDPTVIYGMGERYNGKITRADLREPTPYNTYTITACRRPDRHGRPRGDSRGAEPPMATACISSPVAMAAMCSPMTSMTTTAPCASSSSSAGPTTAPAPRRGAAKQASSRARPAGPCRGSPASQRRCAPTDAPCRPRRRYPKNTKDCL
jgi:hypothetical protein